MTKKQIYEQVVQLTDELAQTKLAKKIFSVALEGDAVKAQTIIDAFPYHYPELNQKIVDFGRKFNKLVGDSQEDKEDMKRILQACETMMYGLAQTKIIEQIVKAVETGNPTKLQEVIVNFKEEYAGFTKNLIEFQKEYNEYRDSHQNGDEGAIFGSETDEDNGVYIFDTNVIDALSFYLLNILAGISDVYFFCNWDDDYTSADKFFDAIEDATNEAFAEFVASYNLVDWVDKDEEYQTVGEILVAALADEFEEQFEEDTEE